MTLTAQTLSLDVDGNDDAWTRRRQKRSEPDSGGLARRWDRVAEVCDHPAHCLVCATSQDGSASDWEQLELMACVSSERFMSAHSYNTAEPVDNNLTWGFTQPPSSHLRQICEIQRRLHDSHNPGWNYANPLRRYVELCSEDPARCSTDVEEVLDKYFKVSSFANNPTTQQNLASRRTTKEPSKVDNVVHRAKTFGGCVDEVASVNEEANREDPVEKTDKKFSLLGVHFLQDKKMFLLKTSHSIRKTAKERYQHLTKAFRLPGRMGSTLGLGASCRRISRFLNDDCYTDNSGARRETCVVSQSISRMSQLVLARVNPNPDSTAPTDNASYSGNWPPSARR